MKRLLIIITIIIFCISCEQIDDDLERYTDLLIEYSLYDYEEINGIEFTYYG